MNEREASYAVGNYMPNVKTVIPLFMFNDQEKKMDEVFNFDEFVKMCEQNGAKDKTYIHCRDYFGGKALKE